ncbi:MAG: ribosome small subunit-dependent GTPase A [Actinobacteria bacterium]|nr:ribosome small subunit-dependent GTPase A [Actinomycetota bacterium]
MNARSRSGRDSSRAPCERQRYRSGVSPDRLLGWTDRFAESWQQLGAPSAHDTPGRVARIDRGWSTVMRTHDDSDGLRVRNIGADVAVGDWVVVDADGERIEHVIERTSAFTRRASHEGDRAVPDVLAANIDVVFLVHALTAPPNQRRLERELVLAFDSGAAPAVVLTKVDVAEDPSSVVDELTAVAPDVPVLVVSGVTGEGVDEIGRRAADGSTLALLGASGVGKSTIVNFLLGRDEMATGAVRDGDQRGRHTTVATRLLPVPGGGWLIDTPGFRAVSLWLSGRGIERAFSDVFSLMDDCRFRDCKHDREPGCAVRAAISAGALDPSRFASLERLVAEEAAVEAEQERRLRIADRRRHGRPGPGDDGDDELDASAAGED